MQLFFYKSINISNQLVYRFRKVQVIFFSYRIIELVLSDLFDFTKHYQ
jgi:hypothetical protein